MFIAARREISATDLRATRYGGRGPATIDVGDGTGFYIMLDTPADCDALIKAAVDAKQLLDPPAAAINPDAQAGPAPLFPCCEHCIPSCDGRGHLIVCTTPGCPSAEAARDGQDDEDPRQLPRLDDARAPMITAAGIEAAETCKSPSPITGRECSREPGHGGMHEDAEACWSRDELEDVPA